MFYQEHIKKYSKMWASFRTVKERREHLRLLLEKKTKQSVPKKITKHELISRLATLDHKELQQEYKQFELSKIEAPPMNLYKAGQLVGTTWIRNNKPTLEEDEWIMISSNCQCPDWVDNKSSKYVFNKTTEQREFYVNLKSLYEGQHIAWLTPLSQHIKKHIKHEYHLEMLSYEWYQKLLETLPWIRQHNPETPFIKKRYSSRLNGLDEFHLRATNWMINLERKIEKKQYLQYEVEHDYLYKFNDTELCYNSRSDTLQLGYSRLQALMAFRGGVLATEEGLQRELSFLSLIAERPNKYKNIYGTLIITNPHNIDYWEKLINQVSSPKFKTIVIRDPRQAYNFNIEMYKEAEIVLVSTNAAYQIPTNTWYRVIRDSVQLGLYNSFKSYFSWIIYNLPDKYLLTNKSSQNQQLHDIFKTIDLHTQHPRKGKRPFPFIRKMGHYVDDQLNIKECLDQDMLTIFFKHLYYRDTRVTVDTLLPNLVHESKIVEMDEDELISFQAEQHNRSAADQQKWVNHVFTLRATPETVLLQIPVIDKSCIEHEVTLHNEMNLTNLRNELDSLRIRCDNVLREDERNRITGQIIPIERQIETQHTKITYLDTQVQKIKNDQMDPCIICWEENPRMVFYMNCGHFICTTCFLAEEFSRVNSAMQNRRIPRFRCSQCRATYNRNYQDLMVYHSPNLDHRNQKDIFGSKISSIIDYIIGNVKTENFILCGSDKEFLALIKNILGSVFHINPYITIDPKRLYLIDHNNIDDCRFILFVDSFDKNAYKYITNRVQTIDRSEDIRTVQFITKNTIEEDLKL